MPDKLADPALRTTATETDKLTELANRVATGWPVQDGTRRPTLALVAEMAGVSLKTASRAINGEKHVALATRERVLDAADAVGFRINAMASLLKRGVASQVVSLITGDLGNPFYSAVAKGIEQELRSHGMTLTIASSDEDPQVERLLIQEFADRRVRALMVVSTLDSHEELAVLRERGIPVIFLDRAPVGLDADSVVLDNYSGTRQAIEQLLALGHRRIGYVSDYARLATHRRRFDAYRDAMEAAGVTGWDRWVRDGAHDAAAALEVVTGLLQGDQAPTALFAGNNQITVGALRAIAQHAPQTALIGFDDFDLADVLGVTTVSYDPADIGRLAARRVLEDSGVRQRPTTQSVLPTRIVQRGSGERRAVG